MEKDFKPSSMKLGNVKKINFLSTIIFLLVVVVFSFFNLDDEDNGS